MGSDEPNKITPQMEELFELEAKYGCAVSHGEKCAPKTYEDGLRVAFEAACKAVDDALIYTGPGGYDPRKIQDALLGDIRRAAQELGIDLSAAPREGAGT